MSTRYPGLYKRKGSKYWWYKYSINGVAHRVSSKCTNEDFAWAAVEKYRKLAADSVRHGAATWGVFKEEYFSLACAGNKEITLLNKKWTVREFERVFPIKFTSELIPSNGLQAALTWVKENEWSLNTIDTHVVHLKVMAKYAWRKGYIPLADWSVIKKFSKKTSRDGEYPVDAAMKIIQQAKKNIIDYRFLTLLYWLNLRRGEAAHAKRSWLDPATRTMHIQKDGAWTPKAESDGRFKTVAIPEQLWAEITSWGPVTKDGYLVTDENGWRPADEHSWSCRMTDLTTRLKLKEPIYCHKFRHSIITSLLNEGASPADVQQASRHRHFATTQRYNHPNTEPARRALQGFADRHWAQKQKVPRK